MTFATKQRQKNTRTTKPSTYFFYMPVLTLVLAFFASTLYGEEASSQVQAWLSSDTVLPGGAVNFFVAHAGDAASISLTVEGGPRQERYRLYAVPPIQLGQTVEGSDLQAAIIPFDDESIPGKRQVVLVFTPKKGSALRRSFNLSIAPRTFFSETINFDAVNEELRESPDPQKDLESEELYHLLVAYAQPLDADIKAISLPLDNPRVTANYGDRRVYHYPDGKNTRTVHYGIDFGALEGTPVYAGLPGKVVWAGPRIVTGNTVVVDSGYGVFLLYFHLSALAVKTGQHLQKGQSIGKVGKTGLATGPHLHYQLEVQGHALDPALFFNTPVLDTKATREVLSNR